MAYLALSKHWLKRAPDMSPLIYFEILYVNFLFIISIFCWCWHSPKGIFWSNSTTNKFIIVLLEWVIEWPKIQNFEILPSRPCKAATGPAPWKRPKHQKNLILDFSFCLHDTPLWIHFPLWKQYLLKKCFQCIFESLRFWIYKCWI